MSMVCGTWTCVVSCASFTQRFPSAHSPSTITKPENRRFSNSPQVLATKMSPLAPTHDSNTWLLDSGASYHVTNDLANLSLHTPYDGTEKLIVGDGKSISIAHTGFTKLNVASKSLSLQNVLHVPSISHNIISISQFCKDNNGVVQFSCTYFCVKDILSGKILLRGPIKQGIYEVLSSSPVAYTTHAHLPFHVLHHRFGHPSFSV